MFLVLPLCFSSVIFCAFTVFFLSVASLKLVQFSFDLGPLFPIPSTLFRFICFTCLPIKLQKKPKPQKDFPKWLFAIKVAITFLVVLIHEFDYIQYLPPVLLLGLYPLQIYLGLETIVVPLQFLLTITLGCDLEPLFNEPYLATSLQDFWGRRWNLMVTDILRSTVYSPARSLCEWFVNPEVASIIGVLATFIYSGLGHEVLYFGLTRELPSGEVTLFFLLHGVCVVVEVWVKKKTFVGRWPVKPAVSRLVTVGFVCVTSGWLFFPQLKRGKVMERSVKEALLLVDFFKSKFFCFLGDIMDHGNMMLSFQNADHHNYY
ncbi:unnamed protein product [Thlaspi arvense]|uniref:Wax synthase domain-containing protein n=1 Tax=Thlaspi arvense TaxID=13288 RepID=A0AAU9S0C1_THLAR|nr:unnamed protein product [Thlaspi arvense]